MGDKTQLLAILLAARYRKPWTILFGILCATLLNHGLAAYLGAVVGMQFSNTHLRMVLSVLFVAFAIWALIPDREDEPKSLGRWGVFGGTLILFFLAEMGDKTQLATVALGAKFQNIFWVTWGTTLGMMAANAIGVVCGAAFLKRVNMKWVRILSALLFAAFAVAVWFDF